MNAKNHIQDWLNVVSQRGHLEKQDIVFLMVQARHLIENCPNASKYETIGFYSDWIVHTKLDRPSKIRLAIFRNITNTLSKHWKSNSGALPPEISKIISLSNLRAELISIFQQNKLDTELFSNDENWKTIVGALTYFLQNKLLVFPIKNIGKLQTIIKEIINIKKPADFWVKNLSIIGIDDRPHWCLELGGEKDTTKIIGELLIKKD
ncbi:hypothetical protein KKB40_00130 [Patescibacteria group bacterium]|nr:hypothetical protein [Patescibacteria group bacterium]